MILAGAGLAYCRATTRNPGLTRVIVIAVADMVKTCPRKTIPDGDRKYNLWDFDGDSLLDGYPKQEPGWSEEARETAQRLNYKGFVEELQPPIHKQFIDAQGHILDQWGKPLHIRFSTVDYLPLWFGIWSDGPDGIPGTEDDITSW